jgi:hypothetical protein
MMLFHKWVTSRIPELSPVQSPVSVPSEECGARKAAWTKKFRCGNSLIMCPPGLIRNVPLD